MIGVTGSIRNQLTIIVLLCLLSMHANGQGDWKLKRNEEGIKVFTASSDQSEFKSIKVECTVNARLSQLVALLLDVDEQHNWVYGSQSSRLVKKPAANEIIFYAEVSVPWPCANRDYIAHITVSQKSPLLVTIDSHGEPDMLPRVDGKVRVKTSIAHWDVISLGNGQLKIIYTVQFDPSGSVPAWLVNMFLTKGPFQTFQKLRTEVSKPTYQNAHFDFIKE